MTLGTLVARTALVVLLGLATAAPAMAGKILLSGGAYEDKNTDLFVNGLRKATGRDAGFTPNIASTANCTTDWATTPCPRIAVITSAKADYATGLDAFLNDIPASGKTALKRGYYNLFQTHGFSPKFITAHVDNYTTHAAAGTAEGDANIAILQQADVVWFTGGDQARISRVWLRDDGSDTDIAAALHTRWNQGSGTIVIAGDSAGNHIVNTTMHGVGISYGYLYFGADLPDTPIPNYVTFGDSREGTSALRYYENGSTMKGLGFMPATLLTDTHFDARSGRLGRLVAAMRDIGVVQGFGVDENTGALVDTGAQNFKVYGAGTVTVADSSAASVVAGTTYKVNGLRVSLLTKGDSYSYATKAVTSTKPAISKTAYRGSYNSRDIFSAYETSKSLTRVVDQTNTVNVGSAPVPSYSSDPKYPSGSPTLYLRFTRDATTRGYVSSGAYTASKVLVDIY